MKKILRMLVIVALLVTSLSMYVPIHAQEKVNLALNKPVTASYTYASNDRFLSSYAVDGSLDSRWATEPKGSNQWLKVDLKAQCEFDVFNIYNEDSVAQKIAKFKIEASKDDVDYDLIYDAPEKAEGYDLEYTVTLSEMVKYRYVKITIEKLIAGAYTSISLREFQVMGYPGEPEPDEETPINVNLALNKEVTASAQHSRFPSSYLTDDDEESRWSSEKGPVQWAYVDLGKNYKMNKFEMIWESAEEYAAEYKIYVSNQPGQWGEPVAVNSENKSVKSVTLLKEAAEGRYVKLEVTKVSNYPSISCRDFKVIYTDEQNPETNVAYNKDVVASSIEAQSVKASNVVDGDSKSSNSRWGSARGNGPHWVYIDLGKKMDIKTVKLFWENRKATAYQVQIADEISTPTNNGDWQTVFDSKERPKTVNEKIIFDETYQARYLRLYISSFTPEDPDGGVTWNTVSLYEIEAYGGIPKESATDLAEQIEIKQPEIGDTKLEVTYPESEDYTIEFNGADYEQVVDTDLTIYEPIVDTEINASFKITSKTTGVYIFKELKVTIPGTYQKENGDNEVPQILPELREWKGHSGDFKVSDQSRIVYNDDALKETAQYFQEDYEDMTGKSIEVVQGTSVQSGDFYLTLTDDLSKGLQDEGYLMEISDSVTVEAETTTGAFWATRTILQALKGNDNVSIPKGTTRDYPLYKVRGFILDVGRKTFTLDYLQQVVKEMSWYKMNDFQVHLNDNLIVLERLGSVEEIMAAYSGFRLESDIKEGGNNGLNKADLTSKDVYYTKDDFRDFIKKSRVYGVDIVPEIDTPAHSLALTKVRPDLRHGTSGRDNDHLNLTTKYDESLEFVQSIFDEYMGESLENPVFDLETTVHVGADEYTANGNAYRQFSNDMLGYVKNSGRNARIWGSLTRIKGNVEVPGEGVQMNIWNNGWANFGEMYDQGFDLINCNDGQYYIVPNAGYYGNYLNENTLYNTAINSLGGTTIPAGDKQMLGGAFAIWNDMTDYLNNGISEYDVYDRIEKAIPLFAAKLWGKNTMSINDAKATSDIMGDAPNTNFGYDIEDKEGQIVNYSMDDLKDQSGNKFDVKDVVNAGIEEVDGKKALALNGNESYVTTGLGTAGLNNDLRVKVKRTSTSKEEQILFESDYGSIKAVQKGTGKVGLSRENFDYSFNYELPLNEWVELEFKNEFTRLSLYVNGELVDVLGDDEIIEGRPMVATAMFAMERIGSQTKAFAGYVDDVRLGVEDEYNSTIELDYALWNALSLSKQLDSDLITDWKEQAKEIFDKANPTKEEILQLVNTINKKLETLDYQEANYSRIEAYLELVKDTAALTKESVEAIESVKALIRTHLPAGLQETVNGYEWALVEALNNVELKDNSELYYYDNAKVKVSASSQETSGESAQATKAIDGQKGTFWHSQWNNAPTPHWLLLELEQEELVDGYYYLPRQSGSNGIVTKYRIEVSTNGTDFTEVASGSWANNTSAKEVKFAPVQAKFVRLSVVESVAGHASAAEVKVHLGSFEKDTDGLTVLINDVEKLNSQDYLDETWDKLVNAISDAQSVLANETSSAEDVENAKSAIIGAKIGLRLKNDSNDSSVSKTALTIAVELANNVTKEQLDKVVPAVVTEFNAALEEARTILANDNATQEEVDASFARLATAMHMLEFLKGDKTELQDLVDSTADLVEGNYTEESWSALQEALTNANTVLNDVNAMQEEVDEAYDNLQAAINGLEEVEVVDKSLLEAMVNKVLGLEEDKYIASTWQAMLPELEAAQEVLGNEKATQAEVDEACDALTRGYLNLRLKPNKDLLSSLINKANGLNSASYTADTWAVVADEVMKAQAVLEDPEASEAEVKAAHAALTKVLEGLEVKPGDTTVSVKTGDTINMMYPLLGLAIASLGFYGDKKRKHK